MTELFSMIYKKEIWTLETKQKKHYMLKSMDTFEEDGHQVKADNGK